MVVKIPFTNLWVNPDFVAFVKPDSDDSCTKDWSSIQMKDGTKFRAHCTPEEVCGAIKDENEIANEISRTFGNAFNGGKEYPAYLEAIAMALGFGGFENKRDSVFSDISSSLDAIASAIENKQEGIN